MQLKDLLTDLTYEIRGDQSVEIQGIQYDSRKIEPGDLFFCISGFQVDGHQFAASAVEKGAVALLVNRWLPELHVVQILVENTRLAMAQISANYYDNPSKKMKVIGITGTNGKTTTTYMIKNICEHSGMKVGLMGTIMNFIGQEEIQTERTTPESMDLQKLLWEMQTKGCDLVVMEVSSHSLALHRVYGVDFDVAVFTNLTQDHLDFHGTLENYRDAKAKLFAMSQCSVINSDDKAAQTMIDASAGRVMTYGMGEHADLRAVKIALSAKGTEFCTAIEGKEVRFATKIPGAFTVYNSLAAVGAALAVEIPVSDIQQGLKKLGGVQGRCEVLDTKSKEYRIILDYAHTPDGLTNIIKAVKGFAKRRVITVFGCGGNRDSEKRPIMGKIAVELSDYVIITSDNPRFEKPEDIISDIEKGVQEHRDKYEIVVDRIAAIRRAMTIAQKDDIILLAGKGHETYQEIKGVKHHFDEKEIVEKLLREL